MMYVAICDWIYEKGLIHASKYKLYKLQMVVGCIIVNKFITFIFVVVAKVEKGASVSPSRILRACKKLYIYVHG